MILQNITSIVEVKFIKYKLPDNHFFLGLYYRYRNYKMTSPPSIYAQTALKISSTWEKWHLLIKKKNSFPASETPKLPLRTLKSCPWYCLWEYFNEFWGVFFVVQLQITHVGFLKGWFWYSLGSISLNVTVFIVKN